MLLENLSGCSAKYILDIMGKVMLKIHHFFSFALHLLKIYYFCLAGA